MSCVALDYTDDMWLIHAVLHHFTVRWQSRVQIPQIVLRHRGGATIEGEDTYSSSIITIISIVETRHDIV